MIKQTKTWAIKMRYDGPGFFCGVMYFLWDSRQPHPKCLDGMKTALFSTRKDAREALKKLGKPKGRVASVVRVRISIEARD